MSLEDLTGKTLGQYQLRQLLGVGGMGAVYRGVQLTLRREVAVKVLAPMLAKQAGYIERFNREAETAAALEHKHIIPIYDYDTQGTVSYVVMRLLPGGGLDDRIQHRGSRAPTLPSLGETADLLDQLASALDYAHARSVVHRDIKPSNIMFDDQGSAYIVDFGIAKLLDATTSLTGTGATMGTPAYMAPEQWKAEAVGPASDQYALGVMTYVLVTGKVPFEAPTPYALMHKHLNETPTPPQLIRPNIPRSVSGVLEIALAKEPGQRYPSIKAFAQAFRASVREQAGQPTGYFTHPDYTLPPMGMHDLANRPTEDQYGAAQPGAAFANRATPPLSGSDAVPATQRSSGATETRPAARLGEAVRQRPVAYGLGTLAVAAILVVILFLALLSGGDDDTTPGNAAGDITTDTPAVDTAEPTEQPVVVMESTATPTQTLEDTATYTATPTATSTATETSSHTPTPTPTATDTPTDTPTSTETPDFEATTGAMLNQRLTATAESWTDTPTPDLDATIQAQVAQAMTATAESWTDTPTPTATPTATPSRTPSQTPTTRPTNTPRPSITPRPTNTPTISAACDGFLPPRLSVGDRACVSDSEPNNLRDYPESLNIHGQIPPGGVFTVLEGPECTSGTVTVWYYVDYNGTQGWTAEGSKRTNTYWLSPLPCPIDQSASEPDLDGTVLEVTQEGHRLNARSGPSTDASVLYELEWGDRVLWPGDSTQSDGYRWLKVQIYGNRTAYIAYDSEWVVEREPYQTTPGVATGKTIRITWEGDESHLRTAPGVITSREVKTLYEGETLTVIGGPTFTDWFLWWELRLPDGRTGWAVDVPGWWQVQ